MHRVRLVFSLALALFAAATTAEPSSANVPTPYSATFPQERTIQTACPSGPPLPPPPGSFCFTGSDHSGQGTSTPPGTNQSATEDFTGFVDFTSPIPGACPPNPGSTTPTTGFTDHNRVTIGTSVGQLFLTTEGTDCISTATDDGSWHAVGGTGMFTNATGSGTVHTQATGGSGSATDPIRSASTYSGQLVLQ
jgi:hypothetical protein